MQKSHTKIQLLQFFKQQNYEWLVDKVTFAIVFM